MKKILNTSKRINKLFDKFMYLICTLNKNEKDFIKDIEYYNWNNVNINDMGNIALFEKINQLHFKSDKVKLPLYYLNEHYYSDYVYFLIGHEKDCLMKIQSGINKLLILEIEESEKSSQIKNQKEITALKARIKQLEKDSK